MPTVSRSCLIATLRFDTSGELQCDASRLARSRRAKSSWATGAQDSMLCRGFSFSLFAAFCGATTPPVASSGRSRKLEHTDFVEVRLCASLAASTSCGPAWPLRSCRRVERVRHHHAITLACLRAPHRHRVAPTALPSARGCCPAPSARCLRAHTITSTPDRARRPSIGRAPSTTTARAWLFGTHRPSPRPSRVPGAPAQR
jgi:hypothetical protein